MKRLFIDFQQIEFIEISKAFIIIMVTIIIIFFCSTTYLLHYAYTFFKVYAVHLDDINLHTRLWQCGMTIAPFYRTPFCIYNYNYYII